MGKCAGGKSAERELNTEKKNEAINVENVTIQ